MQSLSSLDHRNSHECIWNKYQSANSIMGLVDEVKFLIHLNHSVLVLQVKNYKATVSFNGIMIIFFKKQLVFNDRKQIYNQPIITNATKIQ